jgi:D-3-phosphoglycerate dehydrogenase
MKVLAYDPFLSAEIGEQLGVELVELDECLKRGDYITLHLPKNKETMGMIGAKQFAMMKDGVRIVNCARGGIIDDAALIDALKSGKCAGAALDVYPSEPPDFANELFETENVVTTPHLGASTEEAQTNVAIDVAEQIVDVFQGRTARSAVNMPAMSPEVLAAVQPYLPLAERMASLAAQTIEGRASKVEIKLSGELSAVDAGPIARAVMVGLLKPVLGEAVNPVNAPVIAKSRGIEVVESKSPDSEDYSALLTIRVTTDKGDNEISGTIFGAKDIRVVRMAGYPTDIVPEGVIIVAPHLDKPGVIGKVGSILGDNNINIASMHVGRRRPRENAIMFLNVDSEIADAILEKIAKVEGIDSVKQVRL